MRAEMKASKRSQSHLISFRFEGGGMCSGVQTEEGREAERAKQPDWREKRDRHERKKR